MGPPMMNAMVCHITEGELQVEQVHVRFCSTHCEALYELERYDANAHRCDDNVKTAKALGL